MTRILITGANGFVGTYMVKLLRGLEYEVLTTVTSNPKEDNQFHLDLASKESVYELIQKTKPTHLIHLAGQSSVKKSWAQKTETFNINLIGTMHLLEAILKYSPDCRVLSVGSSEEYGNIKEMNGINENSITNPMSPYGISKLSSGLLCLQYAKAYSLNVVHTRTFNHIGPGQSQDFVTQDFAQQIVEIESGIKEPTIFVGNLEAVRDFTDVRDIVKAYEMLLFCQASGEIFNVCSGTGVKISQILDTLISLSEVDIDVVQDIEKLRPSDVPVQIGDNSKISALTGWEPEKNIEESLYDILQDRRYKQLI
ncbi:GDP-mannose 4,6-dehydratase [Paenibacillus sp. 32352]|uniref:GDP-mannose 4,6-dehydratase n=1 Tax=Paenibacillus sp. 32352 TaxID=1969111 RepID=UPI0009AD3565|nr:GDP-mannose 4,6-dehydratase [Paenibacillus sp. 32352]